MEGESEGKKHQCVVVSQVLPLQGTWPTTQAYALTGNGNSDPSVPRRALNPLSHTSQGRSLFFFVLFFLNPHPRICL